MWSWHPKPWQHVFDFALAFGGVGLAAKVPQWVPNETGPALGFVVGTTFIAAAGVVWTASNVAMVFDKRVETIRDARMLQQVTVEEKNGLKHIVRDELTKVVVTGGNVQTAVDKAPEAVRKVPEGFVVMQNTAEVVSLSKVDLALNKVCRYNWTQIENGNPEGDFREVTWVSTGKMSRKTLRIVLSILERYKGIQRAGTNGNSTWIVCDPEVIKRGAHGSLEHPLDCYCDGCKERRGES